MASTNNTPRKKGSRQSSRQGSKKSTPVNTPTKQTKKKSSALATAKPITKKPVDESVIPKERVVLAIEQLNKFITKKSEGDDESNQLLGDEDDEVDQSLSLIAVNINSFTGSTKQFKVKLFDIKNSLYKPWKESSSTSIKDFKTLLILKDEDINKITEDELYDELTEKSGITIDEVISTKDLKTTYKAYESKRAFVSQFSLILADDNVITTLPKLLGGKAFDKLETTPIPIKTYSNKTFSKESLINSVKKIYLSKLPCKLPRGTTLNVHLGNINWFKSEKLAENIESITKDLIKNNKIRAIFIKSNKSPVLPLYYNEKVIDELTTEEKKTGIVANDRKFTIDGVEVELSNFEKSLMEIANPNELSTIFAKNIKDAKRPREEDEKEETLKKAKK